MIFRVHVLIGLLTLSVAASAQESRTAAQQSAPLHRLDPRTPEGLQSVFNHASGPLPLVSAHRGGAGRNYPENCIATFENTLRHTFALLEIDPRVTRDGKIILHHDATLDRTTTGTGRVADLTLAELQQLRLRDTEGKVTEFQIPTLDEALEWARGKTVLVLDQKDVPLAARVKKIEEHKAEAYAMLIVYSYADAKACFALNPNIMMEVMVPSLAKLAEFERTGVPWRNVVAFAGHVPPKGAAIYSSIHERGARCIVGSSRNLDRQFLSRQAADLKQLEPDYRELLRRGADLIETDIPAQLGPLLFGPAAGSVLREFFEIK